MGLGTGYAIASASSHETDALAGSLSATGLGFAMTTGGGLLSSARSEVLLASPRIAF